MVDNGSASDTPGMDCGTMEEWRAPTHQTSRSIRARTSKSFLSLLFHPFTGNKPPGHESRLIAMVEAATNLRRVQKDFEKDFSWRLSLSFLPLNMVPSVTDTMDHTTNMHSM